MTFQEHPKITLFLNLHKIPFGLSFAVTKPLMLSSIPFKTINIIPFRSQKCKKNLKKNLERFFKNIWISAIFQILFFFLHFWDRNGIIFIVLKGIDDSINGLVTAKLWLKGIWEHFKGWNAVLLWNLPYIYIIQSIHLIQLIRLIHLIQLIRSIHLFHLIQLIQLIQINPINPINPINLINLVNPINPINLFNPINLINPFNPINPVNPVNPINPN